MGKFFFQAVVVAFILQAAVVSCNNNTTCNGIDSFDGDVCSGNGDCVDLDSCNCTDIDYEGDDCEILKFQCGDINYDDYDVCDGNGDCVSQDVCNCTEEYEGNNCTTVKITCDDFYYDEDDVCGGNGNCIAIDTCNCTEDYEGYNCTTLKYQCESINYDDYDVCSGNGDCVSQDNCNCTDTDYEGRDCEVLKYQCSGINYDEDNVCAGNGNCVAQNNCNCTDFDYEGDACQTLKYQCNSINYDDVGVCSANGDCISVDTCTCEDDYEGQDCETLKYTCSGYLYDDGEACSGNGNCSAQDTCQCKDGFEGGDCETEVSYKKAVIQCSGIDADELGVCSGNGKCVGQDRCECDDMYEGDSCDNSKHTCDEVVYDDESVCSGHGRCASQQNCECDKDYKGASCEEKKIQCNSINYDEDRVCSFRGVCNSTGHCGCPKDWEGDWCEIAKYQCSGINYDDDAVCNSKGVCESSGVCSCTDSNYGGLNCDLPACYNKSATDPSVCSGNGNCINVDDCSCGAFHTGAECETVVHKYFGISRSFYLRDLSGIQVETNLAFDYDTPLVLLSSGNTAQNVQQQDQAASKELCVKLLNATTIQTLGANIECMIVSDTAFKILFDYNTSLDGATSHEFEVLDTITSLERGLSLNKTTFTPAYISGSSLLYSPLANSKVEAHEIWICQKNIDFVIDIVSGSSSRAHGNLVVNISTGAVLLHSQQSMFVGNRSNVRVSVEKLILENNYTSTNHSSKWTVTARYVNLFGFEYTYSLDIGYNDNVTDHIVPQISLASTSEKWIYGNPLSVSYSFIVSEYIRKLQGRLETSNCFAVKLVDDVSNVLNYNHSWSVIAHSSNQAQQISDKNKGILNIAGRVLLPGRYDVKIQMPFQLNKTDPKWHSFISGKFAQIQQGGDKTLEAQTVIEIVTGVTTVSDSRLMYENLEVVEITDKVSGFDRLFPNIVPTVVWKCTQFFNNTKEECDNFEITHVSGKNESLVEEVEQQNRTLYLGIGFLEGNYKYDFTAEYTFDINGNAYNYSYTTSLSILPREASEYPFISLLSLSEENQVLNYNDHLVISLSVLSKKDQQYNITWSESTDTILSSEGDCSDTGNCASEFNDHHDLFIRIKDEYPSGKYEIVANVHDSINSLTETLKWNVIIRNKPFGGLCSRYPDEGILLVTKFEISCSGWKANAYNVHGPTNDTTPLRYRLFYRHDNGEKEVDRPLVSYTSNSKLNIQLGKGTFYMWVGISSIDGSHVEVPLPPVRVVEEAVEEIIETGNETAEEEKEIKLKKLKQFENKINAVSNVMDSIQQEDEDVMPEQTLSRISMLTSVVQQVATPAPEPKGGPDEDDAALKQQQEANKEKMEGVVANVMAALHKVQNKLQQLCEGEEQMLVNTLEGVTEISNGNGLPLSFGSGFSSGLDYYKICTALQPLGVPDEDEASGYLRVLSNVLKSSKDEDEGVALIQVGSSRGAKKKSKSTTLQKLLARSSYQLSSSLLQISDPCDEVRDIVNSTEEYAVAISKSLVVGHSVVLKSDHFSAAIYKTHASSPKKRTLDMGSYKITVPQEAYEDLLDHLKEDEVALSSTSQLFVIQYGDAILKCFKNDKKFASGFVDVSLAINERRSNISELTDKLEVEMTDGPLNTTKTTLISNTTSFDAQTCTTTHITQYKKNETVKECRYYSEGSEDWSTAGCEIQYSDGIVSCHCNQAAKFGVTVKNIVETFSNSSVQSTGCTTEEPTEEPTESPTESSTGSAELTESPTTTVDTASSTGPDLIARTTDASHRHSVCATFAMFAVWFLVR